MLLESTVEVVEAVLEVVNARNLVDVFAMVDFIQKVDRLLGVLILLVLHLHESIVSGIQLRLKKE